MLFSSVLFLFYFLPALLLVYFVSPGWMRNSWLLIGSLVFYVWGEALHAWVLVVSVLLNYGVAFFLHPAGGERAVVKYRRLILATTVVLNLGLLAWFKYAGFLAGNWNHMAALINLPTVVPPQNHLPLGISFFTFQAISYLVDVYRGTVSAQRRLDHYSVYACLFPHLLAGPIVRYKDISSELGSRHITMPAFASGMKRFIIGMAKKVLVANQIAEFVDEQFALPANVMTPGVAWLAMIGYGLQIYCDFSAYSDMAIGLGRMFGFHFLENFNLPYIARSVQEFWRRWHISLSSWFRDYVYIPLGGSRHGPAREYGALLAVFVLCGLWHGAKWNFVLWGCWHGLLLLVERLGFRKVVDRMWRPLQHIYVLLAVFLGWILFRCQTLSDAVSHLKIMLGLNVTTADRQEIWYYLTPLNITVLVAGALVAASPWKSIGVWLEQRAATKRRGFDIALEGVEAFALILLLILSMAHMAAMTYNPFIYFRF